MIPMKCAMTCDYQFNLLFVVELDVSVFHDMKSMKVIRRGLPVDLWSPSPRFMEPLSSFECLAR